MDEKLLSLPWQIQLALGSGYAAYILAYVGIRDHHRGVDTAFRAIAFGLIATAFLALTPHLAVWARVAGAVLSTLAGGLIWRRFGIGALKWLLRQANFSWSDDTLGMGNNPSSAPAGDADIRVAGGRHVVELQRGWALQ